MNKIKVAKELVKLAKQLIADEQDRKYSKQEALDILIESQGSGVDTLAANMRLVIQRKILDEHTLSYLKKHLPYKGHDVSDALKKALEVYYKYIFENHNLYVDDFLSDSERDWVKRELTKKALVNLKSNQEEIEEQLYYQLRSARVI